MALNRNWCIIGMLPFNREHGYLLIAIGGGGDIVSAAVYAEMLRKTGFRIVLGSIAWERYVNDPNPGPIPIENIVGCRDISSYACIINPSSYALRSGGKIVFQAVNVAKALKEEIVIVDLYRGVNGYYRGVNTVLDYFDLDGVIGIDVGGDVLAHGLEEELWSPLADSMGLAMLNKYSESYLIVHSLGSDGELPINYLLKRISNIVLKNGLLGITGFARYEKNLLEKIFQYTYSEASKASLLALQGFNGELAIRRGSRRIQVDPFSLVSFILDPHVVYNESLVAKLVDNTNSLIEARDRLNREGIFTEYDLEEYIFENKIPVNELDGNKLIEIREVIRRKLRGSGFEKNGF